MAARNRPDEIESGITLSRTATSDGINRTASASEGIGFASQVNPAAIQRSCGVVAAAERIKAATEATRSCVPLLGTWFDTVDVDYSTVPGVFGAS